MSNKNDEECIKDYLPPDFMPTAKDVVCGRGKEAFLHPGNKRFRNVVEENLAKYTEAGNKTEKSKIVAKIVETARLGAPGGFVRFCEIEQLWYEIGDAAAREKVGTSIRETITRLDPEKRAKKRVRRAGNKAQRRKRLKRAAAALDLGTISSNQTVGISNGSHQQMTSTSLPSTTGGAWVTPQEHTGSSLMLHTPQPSFRPTQFLRGNGINDCESPTSVVQQIPHGTCAPHTIGVAYLPLTKLFTARPTFQGSSSSFSATALLQQLVRVEQDHAQLSSHLASCYEPTASKQPDPEAELPASTTPKNSFKPLSDDEWGMVMDDGGVDTSYSSLEEDEESDCEDFEQQFVELCDCLSSSS